MNNKTFVPKLFTLAKAGISRKQLSKDIIAGVVVGIVALPLAIAFAIASGVSPEKGIITAIVAGLLISVLGGSRVQIGGPTGAFIVIVYGIVHEHGLDGLVVSTFMAGFILIALGLARMGNLLKFIPYPLIVGFTSGIAVVIFSAQVKDFLGLPIDNVPVDFLEKWRHYFLHLKEINWISFALAMVTVLISFNFYRITSKVPGAIVAILICTLVVKLAHLPVDTIESTFGTIPNPFTLPSVPHLDLSTIKALIHPALAIALLGGIESLLSAVVADGMTGGRHRSNMELVAQGIANCGSAMFGGIPATGAIARTATNINNGGRTPVAGITHALTLLLIMLLFFSYVKLIPMACLAGVLVVVAYHMSEWKQFMLLLKGNKFDLLVLLVTFFLTVFFDLVVAIEVGIVLSSFIVMKRMSESIHVRDITSGRQANTQNETAEELFEEELHKIPENVLLYEINGALFFGAARKFLETLNDLHQVPKVLILRMRNVPFIDATGIYTLKQIIKHFHDKDVTVILSGLNQSVRTELEKADIFSILNKENVCLDIKSSLERTKFILNK